jgi:hypothetical protein
VLKRFLMIGLCVLATACVTGGPATARTDMRVGQPIIDKSEQNARVARGVLGSQLALSDAFEAAVFDMAVEGMRQIVAGLDPQPEYVARIQELGQFELDNLFVFHMSTDTQGVGVGFGDGQGREGERLHVVAFGAQANAARDQVETRLITQGWFPGQGRAAPNGIALDCWIGPDQTLEVCLGGPADMDGIQTISAEVGMVADGAAL